MPEFSACYFCGTALDAPLSEYPVVPEALHPAADQQRTVVLCPTCRRKLGAVVETILEAVEDAPDDASVQASLGGDASAAGTHIESDDGGFEFPDEASTSDGASTSDEAADEEADAATAEDDLVDEGSDEDGPADEPSTADEDDETTVSEPSDGTDDDAGSSASADEPSESAEGASTTEDEPAEPDTESSAADADSVEDEPQLTALEYNRVMRLLQNREFPVDHEEFKVVATNAYEIGDDEFDTIIEAAAKRDLIGLEGGQIVES